MLWMGDARNNYLPSEEKIFKDLCRRVKKCYWLNPEAKSKWNTETQSSADIPHMSVNWLR